MLYEGMVIGENAKPQDLEVNPLKSKQLTNFRASGPKDEGIRLTPPRRMTLEQAIAYIQDDELVEVTPKVIRIRKRHLDPHERKRAVAEDGGGVSRPSISERLRSNASYVEDGARRPACRESGQRLTSRIQFVTAAPTSP